MKIRLIGETIGCGLFWNSPTRTLLVSLLFVNVSIQFPNVGSCERCGHGWKTHIARRDHKAIQWVCLHVGKYGRCPCEKYEPVVKGAS